MANSRFSSVRKNINKTAKELKYNWIFKYWLLPNVLCNLLFFIDQNNTQIIKQES